MPSITSRGFTLAELLGALSILAIVAALAVPVQTSGNAEQKLDLAAAEISHALQFARSDAVRSGQPRVFYSSAGGQIVLSRLDTSLTPPAPGAMLRHPSSKQNYQLNVLTGRHTQGIELSESSDPFLYASAAGVEISARSVYFTAQGVPHYVDASGVYYRLKAGSIGVRKGGLQRRVQLAPLTGRVTLQ